MVMVNNHYMPGELADYGRKSFALAKERHIKSLEDQFAACAETIRAVSPRSVESTGLSAIGAPFCAICYVYIIS